MAVCSAAGATRPEPPSSMPGGYPPSPALARSAGLFVVFNAEKLDCRTGTDCSAGGSEMKLTSRAYATFIIQFGNKMYFLGFKENQQETKTK